MFTRKTKILIRLSGTCDVFACIFVWMYVVTILSLLKSYQLASASQQRIYILANGKAPKCLLLTGKIMPVEACDHVKMFHFLFFNDGPG